METAGDIDRDTPLDRFGQPGVFSRELDEALCEGRIDFAVHSLKDLPTVLPDGIALAAVSSRADPRDALIGRQPVRWSELPQGATVATSSLRRQAQILRDRPDINVVELRGNVGTRLEKLDSTPGWTAIILAVAGLVRLDLGDRIGERLPLDLMLPAPGQAALAVTVRSNDIVAIGELRRAVNDPAVELATVAERALLNTLEGGCHVPVAAFAEFEAGPDLRLRARVLSLDGRNVVEGSIAQEVTSLARSQAMGELLARRLLTNGAEALLAAARKHAGGTRRMIITTTLSPGSLPGLAGVRQGPRPDRKGEAAAALHTRQRLE